MADIITSSGPTTLAEFESLCSGKEQAARKVLIHTIRDYMPFFDQAEIVAANDGTRDKGQLITGYPEGELRAYNEGWGSTGATGKAVAYESCMVRTRSEIDVEEYKKHGDKAAEWRANRDQAFMRGLARQMVRKAFYGNRNADLRDTLGLANIVTKSNEAFSDRIIDAGGTTAGKCTDLWLVRWSAADTYLFYPQHGSKAGLEIRDMGEQYVTDKNGKRFLALVTEFAWDMGVALYDPESVVRVANIDVSKLSKSSKTAGSADLVDLLTQAAEMMPDDGAGKAAFYMNDKLRSVLRRQLQNRDNNNLTWDTVAGRKCVMFGDIPIHKLGTDVLVNADPIA
ncbi:MAG: hypothetical protein IJ164_04330 [Duodenibacillus sp.]|nr:hypothetical protein [Duodenibacillus sp.]